MHNPISKNFYELIYYNMKEFNMKQWLMENKSGAYSKTILHGRDGLEEGLGDFYTTTYLTKKLGSERAAFGVINSFAEDRESEEDPEGDNARDYLLSIDNAEELEDVLQDYLSKGIREINPTTLGAPQAAADAKMQQQDDENGDMVDNASMGVMAEEPNEDMTGFVNKVAPAETGLSKYLDLIHNHDWFHHFSDDPRAWRQGQAEKADLKSLYSTLTPDEKQKAMDAFIDKYLEIHDPKQFPNAANNVKYLTTNTFKGSI